MIQILQLQGDEPLLERAIAICQRENPADVQRAYVNIPDASKAEIRFLDLKSEQRTSLMRQLVQEMCGQVFMEWLNDGHPSKVSVYGQDGD